MQRRELIAILIDRIGEVEMQVAHLYDLNLFDLKVSYNLRGGCGGKAGRNDLLINLEVAELNLDKYLQNVIPHEIAHVVCIRKPALGKVHDRGWKRVCIALGGDGTRCHDMEVNYVGGNFLYRGTCGTEITVSKRMHNIIQRGGVRTVRGTRGKLDKTCWVRSGESGGIADSAPMYVKNRAPVPSSAPVMYTIPELIDIINSWDSLPQLLAVHKILKMNGARLIDAKNNIATLTNGRRTVNILSNGQREYV
jgi:SprT protein